MCIACRPTTALLTVGRERAQAAQVRARWGGSSGDWGRAKEVNALGWRSRGQMEKEEFSGASFEAIENQSGKRLGGGGEGPAEETWVAGESGGRERHLGA